MISAGLGKQACLDARPHRLRPPRRTGLQAERGEAFAAGRAVCGGGRKPVCGSHL